MNAIIYAAGRGLRLGAQWENIPKILLRFGNRSLLDRHVQNLAANQISHLTVVSGFAHELITKELAQLRDQYPLALHQLINPDFTEGSTLSFHASIPILRQQTNPVLLMDGDVLYPAQMLERLIHSPHPSALLVDRDFSTEDDDPVLVPIKNGRPFEFRKKWAGQSDLVGESIGFFKLAPTDLPLLIEETSKRTEGPKRQDSYDEVIRVLVQAGRFGYEDVTGLPWTEIDFPADIERAQREILPAIDSRAAKVR